MTLWGQSCTSIYTTPVLTHTHSHTHTRRDAKSLTICDTLGSIMYWYLHNACRDTHTPGGQITHHLQLVWVTPVLVFTQRLSSHTHTHKHTHTHTGRPNHSPSATYLGQSCTGFYTTPVVTHTHTHKQTHTHTHTNTHIRQEAKSLTICDTLGSIMYW